MSRHQRSGSYEFVERGSRRRTSKAKWLEAGWEASPGKTSRLGRLGMALVSAVLLGAVAAAFGMLFFSSKPASSQTAARTSPPDDSVPMEQARALARRFLDAHADGEISAMLRQPEHREHLPAVPPGTPALKFVQFQSTAESVYHAFQVRFADGSRRFLPVVWEGPAKEWWLRTPRIDGEAYARHCSVSWKELSQKAATGAMLRVLITPGNYYNFHFSDESRWQCYLLANPDTDQVWYGYAGKDGPVAEALMKLFPKNDDTRAQRVCLRVSSTTECLPHHQLTIDQLLAPSWVAPLD